MFIACADQRLFNSVFLSQQISISHNKSQKSSSEQAG
jgi:hypothetical protein